ncbi:MAG: tetratricopeptide repeat protein [Acidobacteriota bacterium]
MIRRGQLAGAAQALHAYLKKDEASATAHMLLGLVEYEQDRPADSLGEFTRAAQLKTPRASELVIVGLDYVKLRDLANADKWMTVAVQKDPGSAGAWRYLGGIKYSENRFAEAIEAYRHCLQLVPHDVPSEDGIGRSLEGLSRDDEAETAYRQAIAWQASAVRKYAQPLLHLGILLTRKGQAAAGIEYLEEAEAIGPVDLDLLRAKGDAYMQLKQWAEAQTALEKAVALAPHNSHLHWLLATVYRHEGMAEQAREQQQLFASLVGNHSNDKAQ